ncbi:MAG: hypothetical protein MUF49_03990 [Oculatellaceae cyanobacterium Prado106]|nr:hypothetical protein [Oculatellaceae cyanobacterium Prado106]
MTFPVPSPASSRSLRLFNRLNRRQRTLLAIAICVGCLAAIVLSSWLLGYVDAIAPRHVLECAGGSAGSQL